MHLTAYAQPAAMSDAAVDPTVQALHNEISSVQKDLGAQVHQVKSEVGQMRAEMRSELAELRKEMREVMACIGQLMEKSATVCAAAANLPHIQCCQREQPPATLARRQSSTHTTLPARAAAGALARRQSSAHSGACQRERSGQRPG